MPIVSCCVLPHGAIPLAPERYPEYPGLVSLLSGSCEVGKRVLSQNPDLIILVTPHGIASFDSFSIYGNERAEGNAEWLGEYGEFTAGCNLDKNESKKLYEYLRSQNISMQLTTAFSSSMDTPVPLRWGEAIPLWFIQQSYKTAGIPFPRCIILTIPRGPDHESLLQASQRLGAGIAAYFSSSSSRIALAISGDLSHAHEVTHGRLITSRPYELQTQNDAEQFDRTLASWIEDRATNATKLLECCSSLKRYASCGYFGFVIAESVMKAVEVENEANNHAKFLGKLFTYEHPTYYGMMAGIFETELVRESVQ